MKLERVEINNRRWYRIPEGMLYPSASSVLDILFPTAIGFIPEEALVRGTLCHAEIAKALVSLVQGTIYQVHPEEEIANRVAAALNWLVKSKLEILAVESPISWANIGMTPDMLGGINLMGYHVVDWKFAEGVDERYYYQLELYMLAEGAASGTIVQITRKGEVFPYPVTSDPERVEKIKSAINVRHHLDRKEKRYAK